MKTVMKTTFVLAALASLAFAAIPASAQTQEGAKRSGISGAEKVLGDRGDVKGVDTIDKAKCFSGFAPCTPKYAAERARAREVSRARAQAPKKRR